MTKAIRHFFKEYLELDLSNEKDWEVWAIIGVFVFLFVILIFVEYGQ